MGNTEPAAVCYVALGSNLRDPVRQVLQASAALKQLPGSRLVAQSSLYHSEAIGFTDQPDFINAVVCLHTTLRPEQLLAGLLDIEARLGRQRSFPNAPRVIDLDILLYNQHRQHSETLTLPHPRMHERAFVLLPLIEIAPAVEIPGHGLAAHWLQHISSQAIERLDPGQGAESCLPDTIGTHEYPE